MRTWREEGGEWERGRGREGDREGGEKDGWSEPRQLTHALDHYPTTGDSFDVQHLSIGGQTHQYRIDQFLKKYIWTLKYMANAEAWDWHGHPIQFHSILFSFLRECATQCANTGSNMGLSGVDFGRMAVIWSGRPWRAGFEELGRR